MIIERLRSTVVLVMCAALMGNGCASARWNRSAFDLPAGPPVQQESTDRAILAEYVQKLPLGTTVRVDREGGKSLRGTLLKATNESIVVQLKTRIPEPPVEIPLRSVLRVAPEPNGGNLGKAIGIGVAVAAGTVVTVFLILAAIYSD